MVGVLTTRRSRSLRSMHRLSQERPCVLVVDCGSFAGLFLCRTVLFTDRSELGVEQRPVVVLVAQRPGSTEFGDGRSWRDDSPNMLANQAIFLGICGSKRRGKRFSRRSAEVERAGGARARAFHYVEVDHGGFHAGVAQQVLDGADVGAGLK